MHDYVIIQDASPFFIRYTHASCAEIIDMCAFNKRTLVDSLGVSPPSFNHFKFPAVVGADIIAKIPGADSLHLLRERVSLFITQPGRYYRPHKDGLNLQAGINYNVDIRDECCETSWYADEVMAGRPIDTLNGRSREIADFTQRERLTTPRLCSMTARQGEAVLFNTDFFHDFDNSTAQHERTILTLRSKDPNFNFFSVRNRLFGF